MSAGERLLPCPFCGGEADFLPSRLMADGADPPVFCDGCHASALDAAAWNRRADRWMPIETAPTDGTVVLVYAPATDPAKWAIDLPEAICTAVYHEDAGWCICTVRDVTHWRPLPTPPAGDAP